MLSREEFEVWLETSKDEAIERLSDAHLTASEWSKKFGRELLAVALEYANEDGNLEDPDNDPFST